MKITILCIGSTKAAYVQEGMKIYLTRLKHYTNCEVEAIEEKKTWKKLPAEPRKKAEGEAILSRLQSGDLAILLDENGDLMGSRLFAERLEKWMASGPQRIVLIVGGAFGFSGQVYAAVPKRISLSAMTFNHEMVRLFMLEQLYRAFSILRGEPYHND